RAPRVVEYGDREVSRRKKPERDGRVLAGVEIDGRGRAVTKRDVLALLVDDGPDEDAAPDEARIGDGQNAPPARVEAGVLVDARARPERHDLDFDDVPAERAAVRFKDDDRERVRGGRDGGRLGSRR